MVFVEFMQQKDENIKQKHAYGQAADVCIIWRKYKMISLTPITPQKNEFKDNDLVCYCFEYTKKDIELDFQNHGHSKILEKIKAEKKNKGCNCEEKNPKGKWCIGDVHQVVEEFKKKNL